MLTIRELEILRSACFARRVLVGMRTDDIEMGTEDTHEDEHVIELKEIERKLNLMLQVQGSG